MIIYVYIHVKVFQVFLISWNGHKVTWRAIFIIEAIIVPLKLPLIPINKLTTFPRYGLSFLSNY